VTESYLAEEEKGLAMSILKTADPEVYSWVALTLGLVEKPLFGQKWVKSSSRGVPAPLEAGRRGDLFLRN